MLNLRTKSLLRRKGKLFGEEYTLFIVGSKGYRHNRFKKLKSNHFLNWKREWF